MKPIVLQCRDCYRLVANSALDMREHEERFHFAEPPVVRRRRFGRVEQLFWRGRAPAIFVPTVAGQIRVQRSEAA